MAERWIFEHNADDSARFVLGIEGSNPLVVVGVNPSTAVPGALDTTVTKVAEFARRNSYDSWVMLNLYPQRSTDPDGMHDPHELALQQENERQIAGYLNSRPPLELLGAWGELIEKRAYLPQMLAGIAAAVDAAGGGWVSIGPVLKGGHPRHPSRAGYGHPLLPFDMQPYLRKVGVKP